MGSEMCIRDSYNIVMVVDVLDENITCFFVYERIKDVIQVFYICLVFKCYKQVYMSNMTVYSLLPNTQREIGDTCVESAS